MRIDDLGKINRAQHGCIGQNDILRVAALQNRQRRLQRFELSAVRARVPRRIRRQETHILAQMQVPVLAVCKVVHQRLIVVFCDDADVVDPRVGHIREREVNVPIAPAEGQGPQVRRSNRRKNR